MNYTDSNVAITRTTSTKPLEAYLVRPEGQGPFPGVVVIHEIFGLNDNIRDIARRLAAEGYAALAVDLFSGSPRILCMFQAFYGLMFRSLDNSMVKDLQVSLDFLQAQPGVDAKRVGVIGFCMGGSYALQLACVNGDLRAASVFYGQNPKPLEAVAKACPIVGSYPDPDFSTEAGRKLDEVMDKYQIDHDIKIYPGARHSFFNDQRPNYNAEAAADAWRRTLSFFQKHLGA
ncbi:MAG: dienelactone hydrolase family protein [Anaerolineae bacterium]